MGTVKLYTAGTGTIQYDSSEEESGQNQTVREEFNHGVNFLVDPTEGVVHCYLNAARKAPEQFMAVYEANKKKINSERGGSSGLLPQCKHEIESTVEKLDWQLLNDNPGQEWFLALDNGEKTESEPELEYIIDEINPDPPFEFAAPSPTEGINFVRTLLYYGFQDRIGLGTGNPRNVVEDLGVAITVDESVETVKATGETLRRIQEYELEQLKQKTKNTANKLETIVKRVGSTTTSSKKVVETLNSAGFDNFGLSFEHPPSTERENFRRLVQYTLGAFSLTVFVGLLVAAVMGWIDGLYQLLFISYTLPELSFGLIPERDRGISGQILRSPIESWQIVLFTGLLLVSFISNKISQWLRQVVNFLLPGSQTSVQPIEQWANDFKGNVLELKDHSLVEGTVDLKTILNEDIFSNPNIDVVAKSTTEAQSESQRVQLFGLVSGALGGLVLGVVFYIGLNIFSRYWSTIITAIFLSLVMMIGVYIFRSIRFIAVLLMKVFKRLVPSSRRRGRAGGLGGQRSGSKTQTGAQSTSKGKSTHKKSRISKTSSSTSTKQTPTKGFTADDYDVRKRNMTSSRWPKIKLLLMLFLIFVFLLSVMIFIIINLEAT